MSEDECNEDEMKKMEDAVKELIANSSKEYLVKLLLTALSVMSTDEVKEFKEEFEKINKEVKDE